METALYILIIVLTALNLALIVISSRNMAKTLDILFTQLDQNVRNNLIEVIQELREGGLAEMADHNPIRDAIGRVIMGIMDEKTTTATVEVLERDSKGQFVSLKDKDTS